MLYSSLANATDREVLEDSVGLRRVYWCPWMQPCYAQL